MTDRTAKFLARVDAHLPTLPDAAARRSFLAQQAAAWQFRYERFVMTGGESEAVTDTENPPQAADFLMTILALSTRHEAVAREAMGA